MIGSISVQESHFPMLILYYEDHRLAVCNTVEELEKGKQFVVIKTKYKQEK